MMEGDSPGGSPTSFCIWNLPFRVYAWSVHAFVTF